MSEGRNAEPGGLVPAGERSLVRAPGGLAERGLALAADLICQPAAAAQPGEVHCLRGHTDCVVSVALSPDGRFAVSGSWDRTVRFWELATGEEVRRIDRHTDRVSSVAFSSDGRWAISGSWDGTARVWEWETGQEVARFGEERGGMVHCVALSPDGRHAAWAANLPEFTQSDVHTGEEVRRCVVPGGVVRSLAYSPDGRHLLSGSGQVAFAGRGQDSGAVCLWDAQTGDRLWGWAAATEPVLSVAFSTDGSLAFSSTGWPARDRLNVTRLWETASGREILRYPAHRQLVFSCVFLPNERRVLLGGRDRLVRVWEPESECEVCRLEGHTDAVFSMAVSSDGQFALSGSGDRTVRLWRLPPGPRIREPGPAP